MGIPVLSHNRATPFTLDGLDGVERAQMPVKARMAVEGASQASKRSMTLALLMALLTGFVASQFLGTVGRPLAVAPSQHPERTARFAIAFFESVNHALASKDAGSLEQVLGSDYVGHAPASATLERRDDLLQQVADLQRTFPGSRLEVEVISSSANLAVVSVELRTATSGSVLDIPLEQSTPGFTIETLRFDGNQVVERWGAAWWPAKLDLLASVAFSPFVATVLQPRLERFTLDAGGSLSLLRDASHLLLVETGTLTVNGTPSQVASGVEPFQVIPGSPIVLSAYGSYSISNTSTVETTFLSLRMHVARVASEQFEAFWASGGFSEGIKSRTVLVSGDDIPSVKGLWTVSIARLTLAPGTALAEHRLEGAELVVVERGAIAVDGRSCASACAHATGDPGGVARGDLVLDAQEGFAVKDSSVAYRPLGTSPATVLWITISRA